MEKCIIILITYFAVIITIISSSEWCAEHVHTSCKCSREGVICSGFNTDQLLNYSHAQPPKPQNNFVSGFMLMCKNFTDLKFDGFKEVSRSCKLDTARKLSGVEDNASYNFTVLENLNISYNNLTKIYSTWFEIMQHLEIIDLSHNRLEKLWSCDFLSLNESLYHLIISYNHLNYVEISCFAHMNMLHILDLSNNKLEFLDNNTFVNILSLQFLNLSGNNLKKLPLTVPLLNFTRPTELFTMTPANVSYHRIVDSGDLVITDSYGNVQHCSRWIINQSHNGSFIEVLEHKCHKEKQSSVIQSERNSLNICIPTNCSCTFNPIQNVTTINCTNRDFQYLPRDLCANTSIIDLSNNRITTLRIERESEWNQVSQVFLRNNRITTLENLKTMPLKSLRLLDVRNNHIEYVDPDLLRHLDLDEIFLSSNPILCNCNMVHFLIYISLSLHVPDKEEIKCSSKNSQLANRPIHLIEKFELCPRAPEKSVSDILIEALICITIIGIIFTTGKTLYDYRWMKKNGELPRFFRIQT